MATKSKENENPVMELIGQLMRVKKSTSSCHIADLYKSKTIDPETNKEIPIYSIMSNIVFHFTTGATIGEVLADFLWQCDDTGCQPFIEPKIFNAHLAEMHEQEIYKQNMQKH
jgi:hypothetical protein